jgi:hypothetical protein
LRTIPPICHLDFGMPIRIGSVCICLTTIAWVLDINIPSRQSDNEVCGYTLVGFNGYVYGNNERTIGTIMGIWVCHNPM